ncbi:penicillin-binding protein activator [Paracoccus luteus]|uniref:penicillin-binding protein activator n=1 Tax=Paracoccus luteus TaxID=2508543 RepID=UPI00106F84B3|nr:penicillin-binding protein activator [Paracoccus luteus]
MSTLAPRRALHALRRPLWRAAAAVAALALAACQPLEPTASGPQTGPMIDPSQPVQVALLVPTGSGNAEVEWLARSLANAGRMAAADAQGARIDLRVYETAGSAETAVARANEAVAAGAKIIVGPLFAEETNAVGNAMRGRVNVLSYSNNADIAGGNVFVLGNTFGNTADRLVSYGTSQGLRRFLVVSETDTAGQLGGAAIESAIARNRATMAGRTSHGMSRADMDAVAPQIAQAARANNAQAIFLTANQSSVLPEITAALANVGLNGSAIQMMGLTRWDTPSERLGLAQLQNGWFTVPDLARISAFRNRYQAAYGEQPHELGSLAYDGVSAVAALVRAGRKNAVTTAGLTSGGGFAGIQGPFRLRPDGSIQRSLAVATIRGGRLVILDPAGRSFGGAGF